MQSYIPWVAWEQIDIPATGLKQSDPEEFRNSTDDDILIDRALFDINGETTVSCRFGKHGQINHIDTFVDLRALHNVFIMNATVDSGFPLLKLRKPVRISPKAIVTVEIKDTGSEADSYHINLIGYKEKSKDYYVLSDLVTVASDGTGVVRLINSYDEAVILTDISLYMENTGSAARMRSKKILISGGGMPAWASTQVPMNLHFPDRNGVSYIWAPPGPYILKPGEALSAEFRDTSGGAVTVYWSVIGYRKDRR